MVKKVPPSSGKLQAAADAHAAERILAKALAKTCAGKLLKHADGHCFDTSGNRVPMISSYIVNGKLDGRQCQFQVGAEGFTLTVHKLCFHHPELVIFSDEKVVVKPKSRTDHTLFIDSKILTEMARNEFFSRLELLERLNLRGNDQIEFGSNHAQMIAFGADPNEAVACLAIFREFLESICKPPQKLRLLFDKEWLLKPLPKSSAEYKTARHHFGGSLSETVACPYCKSDLSLMAQLDLADKTLPRSGLEKLPVFWCLDCAYWDAAFFDLSGETPRALPAQRSEAGMGDDTGPLGARPLALVPVPKGKKAGRKSKLGGKPAWVQDDETPDCPKCTKQMGFVLQLVSDSHVTYADMGMLYAFACPECQIAASLVQSH